MNKIIYKLLTLFCLLSLLFNQQLFSQSIISKIRNFFSNSFNLHSGSCEIQKGPDLSYENLLELKLYEYKNYGEAFLYYKQLSAGNFQKIYNDKEIILDFSSNMRQDGKAIVKSNKIIFEKKRISWNGVSFNQLVPENENDFLDYQKIKNANSSQNSGGIPTVNYVMNNNIIIDKEICNFTGEGYNNYGKILIRTVTTHNLVTPDNQPCQLFADAKDGAIITFPFNNNTTTTKVFCVDELWNRVCWFDENISSPIASAYVPPNFSFNYPTGIITNGPYIYQNGIYTEYDYPMFICDYGSAMIEQFTYNVEFDPIFGSYNFRILDGSFSILK